MLQTLADCKVLKAILDFNQDRKPKLIRLKLRRMLDGPFTFFRATNHMFASHWAELKPPDLGPEILICGDLHLENFGAYRTAEGDFRYDINDFDESMVAHSSMDLVRAPPASFWPRRSGGSPRPRPQAWPWPTWTNTAKPSSQPRARVPWVRSLPIAAMGRSGSC